MVVSVSTLWMRARKMGRGRGGHASSSAGSAPSVFTLRIINGTASVVFHMPWRESPTICPMRKTEAVIPVDSPAALTICSVTNFDRA